MRVQHELGNGTSSSRRLDQIDPASRCWLDDLRAPDGLRVRKLAELHDLLLRAAHRELGRRPRWADLVDGMNHEELAEEIAGDALLAIVNRLDDYRGESRFTTWAYAVVINMVATKFARASRRPVAVRLDEDVWDRLPDPTSPDPHRAVELRETLLTLRSAVEHELTERQRHVFVAVALNEAPLDELCVQLGSNRNAIYKVLFDARCKLRASLESAGYCCASWHALGVRCGWTKAMPPRAQDTARGGRAAASVPGATGS